MRVIALNLPCNFKTKPGIQDYTDVKVVWDNCIAVCYSQVYPFCSYIL